MSLPRVEKKYHTTKLISNNKEVRFRPFTIGQQKQVMLVKTSSNSEFEIYKAITQMVQDCVEGINILDLPTIDFERLFYDIRSISDGYNIEFNLPCDSDECKVVNFVNKFALHTHNDLIVKNKEFNKTIFLKELDMAIKLKLPSMKDLFALESKDYKNDEEKSLDTMAYGIESVIKGEQVFNDFTKEEAIDFIYSLPDSNLNKFLEFFQNAPKFQIHPDKKFVCEKCKKEIIVDKDDVKSFLS